MTLAEFLAHLLQAHAHTLQRLAALLGEDFLLEILELYGEQEDKSETSPFRPLPLRLTSRRYPDSSNGYAFIESAVHEMKLPAMLEFYLWSYPTYRLLIEGSANLDDRIEVQAEKDLVPDFVNEATEQAKTWIKRLPLPPDLGRQAEAAADVPWKRFRATILKQIGKRPLERVW